jgi:tripartite-type tricarboxylate transporter receptor subunit TctC
MLYSRLEETMNPSRRWLSMAASVAALFAAYPVTAQPYPSRPVTMIVPASAGGPTDAIGRVLAGVGKVARATPDGYTLGIGQFVPYRGTAPAMRDLVAGQIDIMLDQASNVLPQLSGGTIKAFAVTAKERLASAPNVPTVDEAGLGGLYVSVWHGVWAPKGTPADIIAKLNAAIVKALGETATREKLAALGQDIPPVEQLTPQALGAFQKAEIEKWWPIVKDAGIKAE